MLVVVFVVVVVVVVFTSVVAFMSVVAFISTAGLDLDAEIADMKTQMQAIWDKGGS